MQIPVLFLLGCFYRGSGNGEDSWGRAHPSRARRGIFRFPNSWEALKASVKGGWPIWLHAPGAGLWAWGVPYLRPPYLCSARFMTSRRHGTRWYSWCIAVYLLSMCS